MTIRTMESGLLMILEAIRILEPNRAPGESRYTPFTDLESWSNGEALIAIVSVTAGIELLLKQLLIDIDLRLLFENEQIPDNAKLEKGEFKTVSFTRCIHRIQKTQIHKLTKAEEALLFELADRRNKAVHAGFAERTSLEVSTANALLFVLRNYFDRLYDQFKLTSAEHHIYHRIHMTANEFETYNRALNALYAQELLQHQRSEFLWYCRTCDHQSLRIRAKHAICQRCRTKDNDVGECVSETFNQDTLWFQGREYKCHHLQNSTCGGLACEILELTDLAESSKLYCCTNCGDTVHNLATHKD